MSMQILTESLLPAETKMIAESSKDGKSMYLNGIFMQACIRNRNGRVYPLHEISNAVKTLQESIKETGGVFGEVDHPSGLGIDPRNVSHVITEVWMNGNDAFGKARLLDTPVGLIAQELFKTGVRIGVSSRGAGNVNESGEVSGFVVRTIDLAINQSAPGAVPNLMYESIEKYRRGGQILTLAESVKEDAAAQKYFKQEILKFVQAMNFQKR